MRLVGLLAVVAILAVGSVIVLDAVESTGSGDGGGLIATVPPAPGGEGARPGLPPSVLDEAQAVACASERRTVVAALEAHHALHGRYADGAGLVTAGLLRGQPELWTIESNDDFTTYVLAAEPDCDG